MIKWGVLSQQGFEFPRVDKFVLVKPFFEKFLEGLSLYQPGPPFH